jgi:hypothetical protein
MLNRAALRLACLPLLVLWLIVAASPVAADHCPGPGRFADVLRKAEAIALVRVLRVEGSGGLFDMTYTFAQIKTWKGALPPVFEVEGSELGCQFGGDVKPGDQFVVAFGTAVPEEHDETGGAHWEVNADWSLGETGPMDARVETLAELDVLLTEAIAQAGAPPGAEVAAAIRPALDGALPVAVALAAGLLGLILILALLRRSRSADRE